MFVEYGISCAPINGFEIAHKMGVKVIPYSAIAPGKRELLIKESEDGFSVQRTNGQWYIYYNDEKNYRRINNTIMHEIGHIVLDHSEDSELAEKEENVIFGGRLGEYRYYDMDKVIAAALKAVEKEKNN